LDESRPARCRSLMANKETAIDTLVREELGIDPAELGGSPWTAAASSFWSFAAGAIFPVAPSSWLGGNRRCWQAPPEAAWRLSSSGRHLALTGRSFLLSARASY